MTDFTKLDATQLARVTTRGGRKVRILCVDGPERWPVVGMLDGDVCTWSFDGMSIWESQNLILPPEPMVVWLRAYDDDEFSFTKIREQLWNRHTVSSADYRVTLGDEPKIERVE